MKRTQIPDFAEKSQLFDWLIANKALLLAEKKATDKKADGITTLKANLYPGKTDANKAAPPPVMTIQTDVDQITAQLVINTTNLMDSHSDVHIPGLWKKSLSESKDFYLCQEHSLTFEGIITNDVNAYTKTMSWLDLGATYPGTTEALMFKAIIGDRNEYMLEQYCKGYVKNHSVGMRYVKIVMCINDDRYGAEYEAWQKYFPMVANSADAEAQGYFWAVTEAKIIEGSAVPKGSNWITPVQSMTDTTPAEDKGQKTQKDDNGDPEIVDCPNCNTQFDSMYCPGCGVTNDSCKPKSFTGSDKTEPPHGTQTQTAKAIFINPNLI